MNDIGLAKPTSQQLEWADCEIGVIIHQDIQTYDPDYDFRKQRNQCPSPSVFNPSALDTDQWISTAKAAGAGYAVLVAKHCSGFSLWPTAAHGYSVKNSPWKNGKGDLVADFIRSCEKFGLKPGLYCSTSCNAYLNVDNPGMVLSHDPEEQKKYNEIVIRQLTELWSNYGKLFEIWFDGGVLPPEKGGADITPLLQRLQPEAVCFQGPPRIASRIRWVGNERGEAMDPCWSTTNGGGGSFTGDIDAPDAGSGIKGGPVWMPAESDMPNRDQKKAFMGGWFWKDGEDQFLYSPQHLLNCYYNSVGCNTNLLLGMAIDNRGLVPDADVRQFESFGREIGRRFGHSIAQTSSAGAETVLELQQPTVIDTVVIMEEIAQGERIWQYKVTGLTGEGWKPLCNGFNVGHKRIRKVSPVKVSAIRLQCSEYAARPLIRCLSVYNTGNSDQ